MGITNLMGYVLLLLNQTIIACFNIFTIEDEDAGLAVRKGERRKFPVL